MTRQTECIFSKNKCVYIIIIIYNIYKYNTIIHVLLENVYLLSVAVYIIFPPCGTIKETFRDKDILCYFHATDIWDLPCAFTVTSVLLSL